MCMFEIGNMVWKLGDVKSEDYIIRVNFFVYFIKEGMNEFDFFIWDVFLLISGIGDFV